MKAIRVHAFGGPEVLRYEDVADPSPKPGEVVVKIEAAGLNPTLTTIGMPFDSPPKMPPELFVLVTTLSSSMK